MPRREFPAKVKVAAFKRSDGRCDACGCRLMAGRIRYDHVIPDALGGEPILANCQVLCAACHDTKTASKDAPAIAKAKRREAKHIGAAAPRQAIQSRGFIKAPPQNRASRPLAKQLPPRRAET